MLIAAHCEADRLRRRRAAELGPLRAPAAGQPGIRRPRAGPGGAGGASLGPVEPGRGDVRGAERRLALPGRERGGDVPQHLPAGLQLPRGLLPGGKPGGTRLCVPATARRALQAPARRRLPTGPLAAARHGRPRGRVPGHVPPHLLHRPAQAPERPPTPGWHKGLLAQ